MKIFFANSTRHLKIPVWGSPYGAIQNHLPIQRWLAKKSSLTSPFYFELLRLPANRNKRIFSSNGFSFQTLSAQHHENPHGRFKIACTFGDVCVPTLSKHSPSLSGMRLSPDMMPNNFFLACSIFLRSCSHEVRQPWGELQILFVLEVIDKAKFCSNGLSSACKSSPHRNLLLELQWQSPGLSGFQRHWNHLPSLAQNGTKRM